MHMDVSGRLILASASPRRRELLRLMGLAFDLQTSCVDETPLRGETPREHVLRLSELKTLAVARQQTDAWVLGADTIVTIDGEILGKPGSATEARRMLEKLSGREHEVFTGFCIACKDRDIMVREAVASSVLFKEIAGDELDWYTATEEPYDKAGAYAVQGIGGFFIREIRGSCTNVVGLPLCEVVDTLKRIRAIHFRGGGHERCR